MTDRLFLDGVHVTGQTLRIPQTRQWVDFIHGGTVLERCVLDIHGSGGSFMLFDALLRGCRIRVRRPLRNYSFTRVRFEECVFQGRFTGCDFGPRPDESHPFTGISGCDFRQARLNLCRVFDSPVETLRWPPWPCIAVLDPWQNREDWLSLPLPASLSIPQRLIGNAEDLGTLRLPLELARAERAGTIDLSDPRYALDPETVWPIIQDRDYIVFDGKEARQRVDVDLAALRAERDREQAGEERERADRAQRDRPLAFWNRLYRGKVTAIEKARPHTIRLTVDTSFFLERVADAPAAVVVELHDCDRFQLLDGERELERLEKPFTIWEAGFDGDDVLVQAFGRRRIRARYASWRLALPDGTPVPDEELQRLVDRYYGL